jgi:hypothetical protein
MRKLFGAGQPLIEIDELGHLETVLTNGRLLRGMAQQLLTNGIVPKGDGWGGRLGRHQKVLCETFVRVEQQNRSYLTTSNAIATDPPDAHGGCAGLAHPCRDSPRSIRPNSSNRFDMWQGLWANCVGRLRQINPSEERHERPQERSGPRRSQMHNGYPAYRR